MIQEEITGIAVGELHRAIEAINEAIPKLREIADQLGWIEDAVTPYFHNAEDRNQLWNSLDIDDCAAQLEVTANRMQELIERWWSENNRKMLEEIHESKT